MEFRVELVSDEGIVVHTDIVEIAEANCRDLDRNTHSTFECRRPAPKSDYIRDYLRPYYDLLFEYNRISITNKGSPWFLRMNYYKDD